MEFVLGAAFLFRMTVLRAVDGGCNEQVSAYLLVGVGRGGSRAEYHADQGARPVSLRNQSRPAEMKHYSLTPRDKNTVCQRVQHRNSEIPTPVQVNQF